MGKQFISIFFYFMTFCAHKETKSHTE